jgi:hypothetical protein
LYNYHTTLKLKAAADEHEEGTSESGDEEESYAPKTRSLRNERVFLLIVCYFWSTRYKPTNYLEKIST